MHGYTSPATLQLPSADTRKEPYTDKKEKKIFLVYKEIHKGSGAKSYMTNGLPIYD